MRVESILKYGFVLEIGETTHWYSEMAAITLSVMLGCVEWHKGYPGSMLDAKWHSDRVYIRQCGCHGCVPTQPCAHLVTDFLVVSAPQQHLNNTSLWSSCLQMPYIGCDDGALHNLAQHCTSPHHCVWPSVTMSPCVTLCRHVTMLVFLWLSEEVVVVSKGVARVMCRLYYR